MKKIKCFSLVISVVLSLMAPSVICGDAIAEEYFKVETISYPSDIDREAGVAVEALRVLDLGNDGDMDISFSERIDNMNGPRPYGRIFVYRNSGQGEFVDSTDQVLGDVRLRQGASYTAADFNGDGLSDLFIGEIGSDNPYQQGGQNLLLLQTMEGELENKSGTNLPVIRDWSHTVASGDFDNDGDIDIYVNNGSSGAHEGTENYGTHNRPYFLINDGTGKFAENVSRLPPSLGLTDISEVTREGERKYTASHFVDVDNDGDLDLVLGKVPGWLQFPENTQHNFEYDGLFLNDGTGHFGDSPEGSMPLRATGEYGGSFQVGSADMNRDGWPDLVISTGSLDSGGAYNRWYLELLLNRRDGTFEYYNTNVGNIQIEFHYFKLVDINSDGWIDIILCVLDGSRIKILLNKGNLEFMDATDELVPNAPAFPIFSVLDVDSDTDLDIVGLGDMGLGERYVDSLVVLRNLTPYSIPIVGDIDGDKDIDLSDAILALRVLSEITPEGGSDSILPAADVDGDDKIGIEEVLYIIQRVAGLR